MEKCAINSVDVKQLALKCGFDACGICTPTPLTEASKHLASWLAQGYNGEMGFMLNHTNLRNNPINLFPNCRSIIVVLLSYYTPQQQHPNTPSIAKYAWGNDYHYIVKQRLNTLLEHINREIAPCKGIAFCDSAPLFERELAQRAGLGWIGKSSLIIHPQLGSYCFIGELLVDIAIEADAPMQERCGNCSACIASCPTQAIVSPHTINANRCIAYQTIEKKGDVDSHLHSCNQLFGCDKCLEACPWNKRLKTASPNAIAPNTTMLNMTPSDWNQFTRSDYKRLFLNTPLSRAGYRKLRNRLNQLGFLPDISDSNSNI